MLMEHPIRYRPLRAPQADRQALVEPPLTSSGELLATNRARLARAANIEIAGLALSRLREMAQHDLLQAARQYTASYRNLPGESHRLESTNATASLILAGHQPELFHPGVWFKNFALSNIAQQHGAVAINLIIDSDAVKQTSIAVPTGSVEDPRRVNVPFDAAQWERSSTQPTDEVPYEERAILDHRTFGSFAGHVRETIAPLVKSPLIETLWPLAIEQMRSGDKLGEALAKSRHRLEGDWGLHTLELPQSHVCRLPAFHYFTAHLLAHLPRVWELYNSALAEYRRVHRLRTPAQPLPDLAMEDQWLEAPFWCWTKENPERRKLFARSSGDQVVLTDRTGWEARLELTADGSAEQAVQQLSELASRGVKLRTRALATTLFARLVLGDLFLHGIGGAKYDQVTDRLMAQLFDVEPPEYMTISATIKLPIERPSLDSSDQARLRMQLRELNFSPERHLKLSELSSNGDRGRASAIIAEKQRWIATAKTSQNANTRHFEIRRASAALQPFLAELRESLLARQTKLAARMHAESLLGSREYAFCLYEESTLRAQLLEFLHTTS
jgi:hypothetical protein